MSEVTIQFSPKHPLHLACDVESSRYALAGAMVEPHPTEEGKVICAATNSRIMAVVVEDGTASEAAVAPAACFKRKKGEVVEVSKNGEWRRVGRLKRDPPTTTVLPDIEGRFPLWRTCLPDIECGNYLAVSIDPEYLLDLAKSIGCDRSQERGAITLLIPRHEKAENECDNGGIPVIVDGQGIGVIMPCGGQESYDQPPSHDTARKQYTDFVKSVSQKGKE